MDSIWALLVRRLNPIAHTFTYTAAFEHFEEYQGCLGKQGQNLCNVIHEHLEYHLLTKPTFPPDVPMMAPVVAIAALYKNKMMMVSVCVSLLCAYIFACNYILVSLSMFLFAPIRLCKAVTESNSVLVSPRV